MFLFVRHPQAIHNVGYKLSDTFKSTVDNDVTPTGLKQAEELGTMFKDWLKKSGKKVTRVVCSPMVRPMRAAHEVLKAIDYNGTVELDPLLRERYNGSPCNLGRPKSELMRYLRENTGFLEHWHVDASAIEDEVWFDTEVESIPDLVKRSKEVYKKYVLPSLDNDDEITLVFSHGGIGIALTGHKMLYNCEVFDVTGYRESESLMVPQYGFDEYNELYRAHKARMQAKPEGPAPGQETSLDDMDDKKNEPPKPGSP